MKVQAGKAAERVGPMASNAREVAAHKVIDARIWAAPKLDQAAHSVEDQLAPRVSAFLTQAAQRVDPAPARSRKWPIIAMLCGLVAGAVGFVLYRNKNGSAWLSELKDHVKDTAADKTKWAGHKVESAGDRIDSTTDAASRKADEVSGKLS
ncbi:hypothetical protein J5X84_08095 [Streptosporangiaceae bacterium NEAU-GS5]|nr:hypothetical protein [Streptosporangiaceae bacterium NEAU-GS5]